MTFFINKTDLALLFSKELSKHKLIIKFNFLHIFIPRGYVVPTRNYERLREFSLPSDRRKKMGPCSHNLSLWGLSYSEDPSLLYRDNNGVEKISQVVYKYLQYHLYIVKLIYLLDFTQKN